MSNSKLVSVVIPTYKRPKLVLRAVSGALKQTLKDIEVIVVVDGPDPEAAEILSTVQDPRFRFVVLPQNVKLAGARNAGVKEAKGRWIAFLDDDDEWMPNKLEKQLQVAEASSHPFPIVVSRFINRTDAGDFIWPRRLPRKSENLSEYLFVRNSLFQGEGAFLPSTYFISRELLLEFPFQNNKHEDYDWLLRVNFHKDGAGIEYLEEPLAIWHSHEGVGEKRLSKIPDWKYSLEWLRSARGVMTARAYSSFIMTHIASPAASQRDWSAFWLLASEAIQKGNPRLLDFFLYLSIWALPMDWRASIRAFFTKTRNSDSASAV